MPSCFITFEGIDGSGKSTQAALLVCSLQGRGYTVHLTREPGGSVGAEEIRKLLLEGDANRWSSDVELLLFTAARRDHLEKVIIPTLEQGGIVICDRFIDSTRVYQGLGQGYLQDRIEMLHNMMIGKEPDLTFLIDIPAEEGMRRAMERPSGAELRFESKGLKMLDDARHRFLEIAHRFPQRFRVIDGFATPNAIADKVFSLALTKLEA